MNILWFAVGLIVLVIIHEAGHMVVARWCGMRVERFSVFMGRPLISWTRGETEYGVGWLPIGGYVKISGMLRSEEIPPEVEPRAYYNAPVWKRIATILAGPAVNIILAVVLFVISFWMPGAQTVNRVDQITPDSPAIAAGLQPGDRLVSVNGVGDGDLSAARRELQSHPGEVVTVQIDRDGRIIDEQVRLQRVELEDGGAIGRLGITFDTAPYGFVDGLREGTAFSWEVVEANVSAIGQLFTSQEAREQVNSIVGVGAVYNEVADDGWITVIRFFALVSLALGIFNLLPLLPLDGGHIVMALIEKIRGKPVNEDFYTRASFIGFALLVVLTIFIVNNDISKIRGDGFGIER